MTVDKIQVDIHGLSTSPASGGAYALILKEVSGNRRLPIIIGAFEAQSIALEMEGIKPPRPLTHDLMRISWKRSVPNLQIGRASCRERV